MRLGGNQPTRVTVSLGLPRLTDSVTVAGGAERPAAETAVQTDSIAPQGAADDQILANTIDAIAGIGNVHLGTDYSFPPADMEPLAMLSAAGLSKADSDAISDGNPRRLFTRLK